jgi:hypothetical protein
MGTNTNWNVTIPQRVGNKLVISQSGSQSAIDISGAVASTQPITGLILINEGGTRIAKGHSLFLTASNSLCRLSFQGHAVELRFEHADGDVEFSFNGPDNAYLRPGSYENASSRGGGLIAMLRIAADGMSRRERAILM